MQQITASVSLADGGLHNTFFIPGQTLAVGLHDGRIGWNLTTNMYAEFNSKNTSFGYTSGDIFHTDFTAAKKFGRRSIRSRRCAYQVPSDTSRAAYSLSMVGGSRILPLARWWPTDL